MNEGKIEVKEGDGIGQVLALNPEKVGKNMESVQRFESERRLLSRVLGKRKKELLRWLRANNRFWGGIGEAQSCLQKSVPKEKMRWGLNAGDVREQDVSELLSDYWIGRIAKLDPYLASMISKRRMGGGEPAMLLDVFQSLESRDRSRLDALEGRYHTNYRFMLQTEAEDGELNGALRIAMENYGKHKSMLSKKTGFLMKAASDFKGLNNDYANLELNISLLKRFVESLKNPEINEAELAREIEDSNVIKAFVNYREIFRYIYMLKLMVSKGMEQRDWSEFERLYKSIPEEQAKLHELGDSATAELIAKRKKEYGEAPALWIKFFDGLLWEKKSRQSIERATENAKMQLVRIIESRLQKIEESFKNMLTGCFAKAKGIAKERLEKIKNLKKLIIEDISLRERYLLDAILKFKGEFRRGEDGLFEHVQEIWSLAGKANENKGENHLKRIALLKNRRLQWLGYTDAYLSRTSRRGDFSDANLFNQAIIGFSQLERVESGLDDISLRVKPALSNLPEILKRLDSAFEAYFIKIKSLLKRAESNGFALSINLEQIEQSEEQEVIKSARREAA